MLSKRLALFLCIFMAVPALADAPGVYAIVGGTVHPVSGPAIPNGVVIIREGLIEAAGANAVIPADAATVDVKGMHVYPGLIDAQTSLGFPTPQPAQRGRRGGGPPRAQTPAEQLPETSAAYEAARNAKLSEDDLEEKRATGVTSIVTVPAFGIFNGQSVLLNLGDGTMESRIVRNPAALQISFNPRPAWTFPDSLMGVVAFVRQTMMDAQQYAAAHAIYDRNPAGYQRPDTSASLQALAPVLHRDVPVVFVADTDLMMHRAEAIAREFNLRLILSGGRQGYRIADELKRDAVPLFVSVRWPAAPASKEDREEQSLRVIRDRQLAPTTPAALAKAGVSFALVSGPAKTGDYLSGIRKAIDNGLIADDALRATTLWPARILGVDRQLGTLEKGKIANVVVSDKEIFAKDAKVKHVFVDGREVKFSTELAKARSGGASPIDGTWTFIVHTTQREVSISATLQDDNGNLSGTFSGDRGSGDIRNGTFDGTTVEFTINDDWIFHGRYTAGKIEGTVSTTQGTFTFSGSKGK